MIRKAKDLSPEQKVAIESLLPSRYDKVCRGIIDQVILSRSCICENPWQSASS